MTGSAPEFSVIITCYFEERSIDEFYQKLSAALKSLGRSYEIIFVNDGSTDLTFERLKAIFAGDEQVRAVMNLFKNAGQAAAMTAAFPYAHGRYFVFIDSDLQLDPGDLPTLVSKLDEGFDIVSGYRLHRQDSLGRIIPSKIANAIMRKVSQSALSDFGCTFKIFDARLIRAFEYGPTRSWRPAYVIAQTHQWAEVPVTHFPRKYGKSGWTFRKLFAYNMDNLVGITDRPFQILSVLCMLFAFVFVFRILLGLVVPFQVLDQISNGLILNFIMFGLLFTLSVLCAIGEFLIRSYNMLQRHPLFIVRELLER